MQILIATILLSAFFGSELTSGQIAEGRLIGRLWCLPIFAGMTLVIFHNFAYLSVSRNWFGAAKPNGSGQGAESEHDSVNRNFLGNLQIFFWISFSLILTFGFGWSDVASQVSGGWDLGQLFLILLPHVGFLCCIWLGTDWAFPYFGKPWSLLSLKKSTESLSIRLQHLVLPTLLPLTIVIGTKEGLEYLPFWASLSPLIQLALFGGISLLLMTLFMPSVISTFWKTEKITSNDPSRGLIELANKLNLRLSSISIWKTGYRVANAVVIGCIPGLRKILITDVMLKIMTNAELRGIFLHEAGHIRKHHTFWRILTIALPFVLGLACIQAIGLDQQSIIKWSYVPGTQGILIAVILILFTLALFSVLSHQLEMEADRFAVEQMIQVQKEKSDGEDEPVKDIHIRLAIEDYCNALRKTIEVTGGDVNQPTLAHPSIMQRILKIKNQYLSGEKSRIKESGFLFTFKTILILAVVATVILFFSSL